MRSVAVVITGIVTEPQALAGLATLHRKMGQLRESRERYWQVSEVTEGYSHIADAGLAEVAKQSGNFHVAIQRYNELFFKYPDLEDRSRKIYELSRSHLFRLTGQLERAQMSLERLLANYRRDCDTHLQLAKVYSLKGDRPNSRKHFEQAHGPSLTGIASELYALAMGFSPSIGARSTTNRTLVCEPGNYLPEERGLASCKVAIEALKSGEFERASAAVQNSQFVDKLHADFGTVLGFHAAKRMNPEYNHRGNQAICRIAKRGYVELRKSVHAIAEGDFDAATMHENRMCLFVA